MDKASSPPTLLSFLCHDILGVIVGFVEDSRSLAALSKTCQGFNIAINSTRLNLWQVHFEREVGMGGGRKEERLIGAGLSWKEKCRRGLELRKTMFDPLSPPPPPHIFEMPHVAIYGMQTIPPAPVQVIANQSQSTYLGIGYFDCRVIQWDSKGGPSRIAVWGDYFGLRLVSLPSMQVKTVANNINHGKVMTVVEHPNGKGLFLATTEGHVIATDDLTKEGEGTEGEIQYRFHAGAHGGGECNYLQITSGGALLSASADGKVVLWPDAITQRSISNFQVMVEPHPGGLIVCQTLFEDDFLISGDFKGKIAAAHIGTVDIALRVGGLLVTTGKGGIIKVWEAGRQGDQRPEMLQTYSLNRQTSTSLGSGSFGVVEEAWSEDRVVGLDMVGGSMVGLRQDGFFGVWRFAPLEERGGEEVARSVEAGLQRMRRERSARN
ncbi:hypothetical protein TrCOL_g9560 [Triparma columacea]|uniref:F-box domain-containing protein n=1 Tax=Triparma columacea TaxID=722753 RepID=A0A9W7GI58_9STRA|nr:hypothetical protein TrCOL_g9560 [Triparma columacea]